ncbi:MAG: hypothetical protein PQ612_06595 [Rickettsiales bacterium]|nr:hypothetical protein [Pseudomonadota bacterium]MDA0966642.1 hypothetical protein [Pseudomonadota bacterium]MDG4543670.1 hypothetical protein [Rickettsiales bacterium]MDG4545817.1 hypothetical protein [Rickettsiales bacterium]MDG4547409.1 hypothetical protein [Rickettsiales bacterium]
MIVDPLTGAMYKLPDVTNSNLEEASKTSMNLDKKEMRVVSINELTNEEKSRLIRIN